MIRAKKLTILDGTLLEVTFQDGKTFQYDVSRLFDIIPVFKKLQNRSLFIKATLDLGGLGIVWNDEIDLAIEEVYENGRLVKEEPISLNEHVGVQIAKIRDSRGLTQTALSKLTGIDQGDISKIEDGLGNPTLKKLERIAKGLEVPVKRFFE